MRKVLELIAFSSLVANKEKYSLAHEKYLHEWRTGRLLENLAKLNPDFYPKPVTPQEKDANGVTHFIDSEKSYLNRDEFTKLLNLCSDILHVWNPYSPRERVVDFSVPILEWMNKIQWLLDIHYVRLADNKEVLLVYMSGVEGKVTAYLAAGTQTPA